MRFFVLIVLVALALATAAPVAGAGPQPTAQNGTATTTTPAASTSLAPSASSSSATSTPGPLADTLEKDPRNATLGDVQRVAEYLADQGADRGGESVDRAREWLANATEGRDVDVDVSDLGGSSTATSTPAPTSTPTPDPDPEGNATRIDSATEIVGAEFDSDRGVARVTIRSSTVQTVTLSSGAVFADGGGEGSVRSVAIGDETTTVEIPTQKVNGQVGVVIATDQTPLYGYLIEDGGGGLDILKVLSSLQAWVAGAGIAFVWMAIAGWNVMRNEGGRPEVA